MVVEKAQDKSGQSIVEFLLMLPLVVGMMVTLVKVNTAAQVSIVNQQYARAHALFLSYNNPNYPNLNLVERSFIADGINSNQMVILVGENIEDRNLDGRIQPEAPTQDIAKDAAGRGGGPITRVGDGTSRRGKVRVLTSVSLCTQSHTIGSGGRISPASQLSENQNEFRFCSYPFMENGGRP